MDIVLSQGVLDRVCESRNQYPESGKTTTFRWALRINRFNIRCHS